MRIGIGLSLVLLLSPMVFAENWTEDFDSYTGAWQTEMTAAGWTLYLPAGGGYFSVAGGAGPPGSVNAANAGSELSTGYYEHAHRTWTADVPEDANPVEVEFWWMGNGSADRLRKGTLIQDDGSGTWIAIYADPSPQGRVYLRVNPTGWTNSTGDTDIGGWAIGQWIKYTIHLGSTDAGILVDDVEVFDLGAPLTNGTSDMLNHIYIGNYYPWGSTDYRRAGQWDQIRVEKSGADVPDWALY